MITTKLILCIRYYTHSRVFGKIKGVQDDLQTFYAIKFQGPKTMNLSLNPGCETSSTPPPNYSFEHATHRAVMLHESSVRLKISKTMKTTELIFCMRYSTHSEHSGKIKGVQNDFQTFHAIKFQGQKSMNLSLNLKRAVNR